MLKVVGHDWRTVGGVPCIVFRASDGQSQTVEVAYPLAAFLVVGGQAQQRLNAAEFAKLKASAPGPWHHARFHDAQRAQVGTVETTEPRRVGLILDPDQPSELALSLVPSVARDLAQALVAAADQIEQSPKPSVN